MQRDERVTALLGPDVSVGGIFSSSSSNINGQKSLTLGVTVSGGGSASLRGEAVPGGTVKLSSLQVSAGGQVIDVPVGMGAPPSSGSASSGGGVIDIDSVEG